MYVRIALSQVEELGVLGCTEMGDDGGQIWVPAQYAFEFVGSGETSPRNRATADMYDNGNRSFRQQAPRLIQDWLADIEPANLRMDFEDPRTAIES